MNIISASAVRWALAGVTAIAIAAVAASATPSTGQESPAAVNDGKARRAAQVSDMKALRDVGRRAPEHEVSRINAALENAIALRDHATPENVIAAVRKERFAATVGMGDKAVCLSVQDAGGSGSMNCRPLPEPGAAAADQAPMISVDTTETGYRVTALVSDAVKSGSVVDVQGKTVTSAVVNNVFVAETTDNPKNLTLRSAKGGTNEYPFLGE